MKTIQTLAALAALAVICFFSGCAAPIVASEKNEPDDIAHYIAAADEALSRFQQTGDPAYLSQHREYTALAKECRKRTKTGGTKLSR